MKQVTGKVMKNSGTGPGWLLICLVLGMPAVVPQSLAFEPQWRDLCRHPGPGIFYSQDQGKTFQQAGKELNLKNITTLAVTDNGTWYAALKGLPGIWQAIVSVSAGHLSNCPLTQIKDFISLPGARRLLSAAWIMCP